ncbi:hypothetical protein niasHT_033574 [Heterodera trifolii]|uniref:Uncharacterized protein n=1 Tax=Heterodera trifolii TaxID=157864 RepID=A0ABD2HQA5_9BILA
MDNRIASIGTEDAKVSTDSRQKAAHSTANNLVSAGSQRKEGITELEGSAAPPKPLRRAPTNSNSSPTMASSLLLGVQFFERLSFHTLKGTLFPLMVGTLHVDEASANAFILLCIGVTVFSPIVGAAMADAKNGNYGLLASMFPLYFVGQLLFTIGPVFPGPQFLHPGLEKFALFFLVYACGGIRAVLPAFGADQISPPNVTQIGRFFAFYYAVEHYAIILAATFIIPKLQGVSPWPLPPDQPLLIVLLTATGFLLFSAVLLIGANRVFRKRLPSPGQNVFSRCYSTIKTALHNKRRYKQRRMVLAKSRNQQSAEPKNLLDHFLDDHNCERDKECDFGRKNVCGQAKFLEELRAVLSMMLLFVPMPLFWAYQSQMLSIWSIQRMNVDPNLPMIGAFFSPDQIGLHFNIFVLVLIPILYYLVYQSSSSLSSLAQMLHMNTYLKRMASGIFLCALASAVSATVQFRLNNAPSPPLQQSPKSALLKVFNIFPSDCVVSVAPAAQNSTDITGTEIPIAGNGSSNEVPLTFSSSEVSNGYADLQFKFGSALSCGGHRKAKIRMDVKAGKFHYAIVGPQGILASAMDVQKPFPADGQTSLGIVIMLPCNSLEQQSLPSECANATQNSLLTQALTPFASPFAICPTSPLLAVDNSSSSAVDNSSSSAVDNSSSSAVDNSSSSAVDNSSSLAVDNSSTPAVDNSSSSAVDNSSSCTTWELGDIQNGQLSVFPPRGDNLGPGSASIYAVQTVPGGMYTVPPQPSSSLPSNSSSTAATIWDSGIQLDGNGGVSLMVLSLDGSPLNGASPNDSSNASQPMLTVLSITGPNTLGIHWLLPQYVLAALSEILLSITALEFCYIQAPISLKATMISYWFLMIYIGWSLVPLFARFQWSADPLVQLVAAACAMLTAGALFAGLAHFRYTYKDRLPLYDGGGGTTAGGAPNRKAAAQTSGVTGGALTEVISGLRASVARLPKRRVIRL